MAKSLYIASLEKNSGKLIVTLGVTEMLSRHVKKPGFFRAISTGTAANDSHIKLLAKVFNLATEPEEMVGVTHEQAKTWIAEGHERRLFREIVSRYKQAEEKCDFLLCEGPDITHLSDAFDYNISIRIARELGIPALYVSSGYERNAEEIIENVRVAINSFKQLSCPLLSIIVNRVNPSIIEECRLKLEKEFPRISIELIPEIEALNHPTMAEIIENLDAEWYSGPENNLQRNVNHFKVAAMSPANFLNYLKKDDLIITPGDRSDIIFTTLAAIASNNYPSAVGIILSGNMRPPESVANLLSGLDDIEMPIPIYGVKTDTFETAMLASSTKGKLRASNMRKITRALGVFESNVDTNALEDSIRLSPATTRSPLMFEYYLFQRARKDRKHIVLPEGNDDRILRAAELLLLRKVVDLTILGKEKKIRARATSLGLKLEGANFIDPETSELREKFAKIFYDIRKSKGITMERALDTVSDVSYFGTMMVHTDMVDGMVSGAAHTTAHTIRPAFQIIKTPPDVLLVSSVFFMCLETKVLVYGDCAINPNPNAEELADIAINSSKTAKSFGIDPIVAMLSYSSGDSGHGTDVDQARKAVEIAKSRWPELVIDGPIQYDAAIDAGVAAKKMPNSRVAGKATVFIFPDLNTGNNTYKAVQRSSGAIAIGPVLQGLNKPVNDLSRGCTVSDIINTVAITAIQAQEVKK